MKSNQEYTNDQTDNASNFGQQSEFAKSSENNCNWTPIESTPFAAVKNKGLYYIACAGSIVCRDAFTSIEAVEQKIKSMEIDWDFLGTTICAIALNIIEKNGYKNTENK